jgi:hypothetical protein
MNLIKEFQKVSTCSEDLKNWYWSVMNKRLKKIYLLRKCKWLVK